MTGKLLALAPAGLLLSAAGLSAITDWITAAALTLVAGGIGYWLREVHLRTQLVPLHAQSIAALEAGLAAMRSAFDEHLTHNEQMQREILRSLDELKSKMGS